MANKLERLATTKAATISEIVGSCRLTLFGGKGGVGKTTIAAAMAVETALRSEEEILLVSLDPSHSLSDMLKNELIPLNKENEKSPTFTLCTTRRSFSRISNLSILELDFSKLTEEFQSDYGMAIERLAEEGTLLTDGDIKAFVDVSLPALGELMALMEITEVLETNSAARVILDSAPTGHTLRLLDLPDFLRNLAEVLSLMDSRHQLIASRMVGRPMPTSREEFVLGDMTLSAQILRKYLNSPTNCGVITISLPERLPLAETEHMIGEIIERRIPMKAILINKVVIPECSFCSERFMSQQRYLIETLEAFSNIPVFIAPLEVSEPRSRSALLRLASNIHKLESDEVRSAGPQTQLTKIGVTGRLPDFAQRGLRLVIFAGKGGVGKTTIAAASALALAKRHSTKNILVVSIDPAHSLGHSFGQSFGTKPNQIEKNLWVAEVNAKSLLAEFKEMYFKEVDEFLVGLLPGGDTADSGISCSQDREITEKLLNLETPDLDEFMVFRWLTQMKTKNDFDLILLDPAPAGHLLRFLELPNIAIQWIKAFLAVITKHRAVEQTQETVRELLSLMKAIRAFKQELMDPQQTALVAVGTPQEVVLAGMMNMLGQLGKYSVRLDSVIINMVRKDRNECSLCHQIYLAQEETMKRYKQLAPFNLVTIAQASTEIQGTASLTALGGALYE